MKPIFLMGFMGCGKSAVARSLSRQLQVPFIDLDARIIERQIGIKIADFFADKGEEAFRELETKHLSQVAMRRGRYFAGRRRADARRESRGAR